MNKRRIRYVIQKKVMDHFQHPRNVGEIENASGVGTVGNAKCGDIMKMYLKVKNGVIEDVNLIPTDALPQLRPAPSPRI